MTNVKTTRKFIDHSKAKPGSHMPPIYLGHRLCYGVCKYLSPNHNLSHAGIDRRWAACEVFVAEPAVVGNENILCAISCGHKVLQ